jgi:tripartite-type tricarboxylate transporter receptor subunit TctC
LYKQLCYDPQKDLATITLFGTSPIVLLAHLSVTANSVGEVLKAAKTQPGKLSCASGGNGTAMHLSGELLKSMNKRRSSTCPTAAAAPPSTP